MPKLSEMAYAGAEYLSEHEHAKGEYSRNGAVCMMGAILGAYGCNNVYELYALDPDLCLRFCALQDTLIDGMPLPDWNDRSSTTKEDAVLKLKEIGRMGEENGD